MKGPHPTALTPRPPRRPNLLVRRRGLLRTGVELCLTLSLLTGSQANHAAEPSPNQPFNIGFLTTMFTDVNETDAKAAIKGWARTIARQLEVPVNPEPQIFANLTQVGDALRANNIDALALTFDEYSQIRQLTEFSPVFVTRIGPRLTERYVVYSHRESSVKTLADLAGRSVLSLASVRTCLGPFWLDNALAQQGLPPAETHIGRLSRPTKISRAVLPVFFRQADACLVTESGFQVMSDLNPQLAKHLVPIAVSPEIIPAIFAIRAEFTPPYRDTLLQGLRELNNSPAGQQVLTVFQGDALVEIAPQQLEESLRLIATYQQTHGPSKTKMTVDPQPPSTPSAPPM